MEATLTAPNLELPAAQLERFYTDMVRIRSFEERVIEQFQAGAVKGKFAYMSPEQTRGEELTPASDLFSTGVVLWETLAGQPLFDRETDLDTAQAVRSAEIPNLHALRPEVSPA